MKLAIACCAALLAACAGPGTTVQNECEARFTNFAPIYWCTRDGIAARSPGVMRDPRAKLYMLRGEQLAAAVEAGKMTSIDAKVEWQKLFVDLKSAHDQEIMQALAAMPRPAPMTSVNCTSTKGWGNTVNTECH